MSSTTAGFMECASITGGASPSLLALRPTQLRLEDRDGAGRLPHRHGVDEHQGVVPVEQLVGQVHAADPEVGDPDTGWHLPTGQPVRHLDAEPVVTEEDVADAGDQHLHGCTGIGSTSISSGWK